MAVKDYTGNVWVIDPKANISQKDAEPQPGGGYFNNLIFKSDGTFSVFQSRFTGKWSVQNSVVSVTYDVIPNIQPQTFAARKVLYSTTAGRTLKMPSPNTANKFVYFIPGSSIAVAAPAGKIQKRCIAGSAYPKWASITCASYCKPGTWTNNWSCTDSDAKACAAKKDPAGGPCYCECNEPSS